MTRTSAAAGSLMLEGDWCAEQAAALHRMLADRLALLEHEPAPDRAELEMSRITAIDACGCQLLTLFIENLNRRGIPAATLGAAPEVLDKIRLLGFSGAIAATGQEKGSA